ncbi:fungal specific transcription factor domain-containing protein [Verticillium alfalfae VaMs.102]|uniref:Fungal specific transcription factor domain-containing protein n=1 Tax=Verticillium alfalfae (strain VaMs.102 / ATCC MYA-4576 / FGSC 10136) TaxID=526221 RepID=C9SWT6_VERA1|nr:fungal specific transcription factor domain-containing protein [Verticillium alfalfae VaMs.102]EEY23477.1 fungal specific transcription factor domain-containing protein [Verticillium alfalfae VaMs.102]
MSSGKLQSDQSPTEEPPPADAAHVAPKAIRCDRSVPCSPCVRMGLNCVVSPRVRRHRRPRTSAATGGAESFSSVAERLEKIESLMDVLTGDPHTRSRIDELFTQAHRTPSTTSGKTLTAHQGHQTIQATTPSSLHSNSQPSSLYNTQSSTPQYRKVEGVADDDGEANDSGDIEAEGPSSLSAHSKFAADYIEGIVALNGGESPSGDTLGLLNDLQHKILVVRKNQRSLKHRLPTLGEASLSTRSHKDMIPLDVAIQLLRKSRSLLGEPHMMKDEGENLIEREKRPSLAWDLIVAAREISHSLGYHKRQRGTDGGSQEPNHAGLLFWLIYFFEKTLSLRLGRASTISEVDVTVPPPGSGNTSCPVQSYCYIQVRMARLAGMIYTDLYSAQSLLLDSETRRASMESLSRHAREIHEDTLASKAHFERLGYYETSRPCLEYLFIGDEVAHFSVLTMIHRAAPSESLAQPFSNECIAYARQAFARHDSFDKSKRPVLFSYMNWALLFLPFIPFFVLFCNVVENGSRDDLKRLEIFVQSIGAASEDPGLADHYQLFGAFYNAAQQYTDSRTDILLPKQTREELDQWMESYLSPLGLQGQMNFAQPFQGDIESDGVQISSQGRPIIMEGASTDESGLVHYQGYPAEQLQNLNWFGMNQQHSMDMMNFDSS